MNGNVRQTAPELTWGTLRVTCDNSPTADGTGPQKAPEGTEDMNSIDNLREYALTAPSICSTTRAILVGYIDNIEREVGDMVPLPVDADGVPIHVGDVMEWPDCSTAEVVGIGNDTFFYIEDGDLATEWSQANDKIHHHAQTVEDVLREFGAGWYERMRGPETFDIADYVERYAATLRLAEGEDA